LLMGDYLFEVITPLNITIHTTSEYWNKLLIKHPELEGKLDDIKRTLEQPSEIRKSKRDELIFLFYSESERHWLWAVAKKSGVDGFLVTAYLTDKIKEGETIWRK
jgi:hypothetical protein